MDTTPAVAVPRSSDRGAGLDGPNGSIGIDYASVVADTADWTTVTGVDGRYRYVSPAGHRLVGWTRSELEGSSADDLVHPDDVAEFREARARLGRGQVLTLSYRLRCQNGSFLWVEETSEVVQAGRETLIVSTVRDITQRHARLAALEQRAASDPLTGVANRAVLMDRLGHALSRLTRGYGSLAVLYLDLDRFKVVNDSFGHQVGDGVLAQMAERLTHFVRPSDTLARLGGDEFVIVAEDMANEEKAVEMAGRILNAGHTPFEVGDARFECTVSVGIACTSDARHGAEELLHEADLALYRAKDLGRDRAEVFDEDLRSAAIGRMATGRLIRRAIDEHRLVVDYQPIIDLRTNRMLCAEALVRIDDPDHGLLLPASFLEVADEIGLLVDIEEHVLSNAVRQAATWRARSVVDWFGGVAINITARHFADASFRDSILEKLDSHGVAPRQLQVEMTERVLMEAPKSAMTGLRSLRDAGVRVGLDDFGTGFSALAHLRQLPVDFVKIDRTVVADIQRGAAERAIVAAIIEVAHASGLDVIAAGVETATQREILMELCCDAGQGFLLGPPSVPGALDELVPSRPRARGMTGQLT